MVWKTKKRTIAVIALAVTAGLGTLGCASGKPGAHDPRAGALQEFTFDAGAVRDGRVYVDEGVYVEQEEDRGKVVLRRNDDPRAEIDCGCFIEGDGFCFPVVHEPEGGGPEGPIVVQCAAVDCSGREIDFCVMDISGRDFDIQFEAVRTRAAAMPSDRPGPCGDRRADGGGAAGAAPGRPSAQVVAPAATDRRE